MKRANTPWRTGKSVEDEAVTVCKRERIKPGSGIAPVGTDEDCKILLCMVLIGLQGRSGFFDRWDGMMERRRRSLGSFHRRKQTTNTATSFIRGKEVHSNLPHPRKCLP